jgi:hypothetical protein
MKAILKAILVLALQYLVPVLMRAAERRFDLPKSGEEKKAYVIQTVAEIFGGAPPVATEIIEDLIEGSMATAGVNSDNG